MMAKGSTSTATPRLRFPEFRESLAWKPTKLGGALKFQAGFPFPSKGFTDEGPGLRLIRNRDLRSDGKPIYYADPYSLDFVVADGDVLVGMDGDFTPCVWNGGKALLNQRVGRVLPKADNDKRFLLYFLTVHLKTIEDSTARTTVKHLSHSDVEKICEPLPCGKEQRKIADCLTSLDEVIAAQGRKVEALKTHKRGLMQQLFPREGETRPRLRFPEFRNAPEWVAREVGDVFRVTRGEVLAMPLVKREWSDEAPYPVYSSQTKNRGLAGYFSGFLYEDAITWTTDGANAGDVRYREGKFYCTNVCGVLLSNEGHANACISSLLNTVTRGYVSYVGNPKLMNGVMAKIVIPFPSLEEQQRIADCLSSLDTQVAAESNQLAAFKIHKHGVMQQPFPAPEAIGA